MPSTAAQPAHQAYVALGSNLDDPASHVRRAFGELAALPASRLLACSALYRSAPVGPADQPDFINAVARMATDLTPVGLLAALLAIEQAHGRVRAARNAPRTLDLDILMYDDLCCSEPELILPHPRMHQRAFVLRPLAEIAPDCRVPGRGMAVELLAACAGQVAEPVQSE